MAHVSQKIPIFFRNTINLCAFRQKHTLTPYPSRLSTTLQQIDFYDKGKGRPFLFSFLQLQTSCLFPKAAHQVMIGANLWIVITKQVGAYNDKVPWGCRTFRSWKGSATRIPCWSDLGLREVSPVGIKLSILRPGLVNQSQEKSGFVTELMTAP